MMLRGWCGIKHANSASVSFSFCEGCDVSKPNRSRVPSELSDCRKTELGPAARQSPDAARPSTLSRHIGCRAETAGTFNTSFRVKKSGILTKFASEKINEPRGPMCERNTGGFLIFLVEICDIPPTVAGQWCFVLTKSYLAAAVHERK